MNKKISRRKALSTAGKVAVGVVGAGVVAGVAGYFAGAATAAPPAVQTRTVTQTVGAATVTVPTTITQTQTQTVVRTETRTVPTAQKVVMGMVLGGYIEGSTWDGRQIMAAERLKKFYPWFDYIYDEGVILKGKDPISAARDLITVGNANIIFGSWEPTAIPGFHRIADEFPNVYFLGIVGSDVSSRRNFMRVFVRQYQAMYLEGLIAGALTRNKKIGIAVGPAAVQNFRRMAAFYLGIKEANPDATLYIKYVGEWFDPPKEREVSLALLDQGVDVLTHYTDSVEPLKVAEENKIWFVGKDMDIVGLYGWSSTDTVAVSFDTRWEVMFDRIIREYLAGITNPDRIFFVGMNQHISTPENNPFLPGQTIVPAVDLQNNNRIGVDAISPKAKPLIPDSILRLVEKRRALMMAGAWDPFYEYELVSSGEGIEIPELNLKVPSKGTVVKPAKEMPSDEWLLGRLNFQLDGIVLIK
ncbi:MAG: BMP family ABC transporter substrate-binding protein [Candidatus Caldarchaeum sp.]|nr:BMP family ABC transporter substrate-binding protein [Candidatus Caldarchaeum sp.]